MEFNQDAGNLALNKHCLLGAIFIHLGGTLHEFLASIGWLCYAAAGVSGPHKKTGRESAGVSGCADFDYKRFVWHTNCC
jgi:hypothetical protein